MSMISNNTVKGLKDFLRSADSSLKISGKKSELLARKVRYLTYSCLDSDFKQEMPSRDYRVSEEFYMRVKYYCYIALQHHKGNISKSAEKELEEEDLEESKECESECCICMSGISGDLFTGKCGHKFHGKCIAEWFKRCSQCPLCRAEIDKKVTRQRIAYTSAVEHTALVTDLTELDRILFKTRPVFSGDKELFKKVRERYMSNLRTGLDKQDEIYLRFYRTDGRLRIADLTDEQVINHIY